MPRRIEEDHKQFRDVYGGIIRKALKKFINNGSIFRTRGDGKKVIVTIPKIDIPHIVYGDKPNGVGRGKGEDGKIIGKDKDGKKGDKAGNEPGDGVQVALDMEEVMKFLQDELKLPDLKPKPNQTFEEIKIKYNNIALTGPESLRHNRRTMMQAMKRMAAAGNLDKLTHIPGMKDPIRLITPINSDRRYRQYREIRIPSSNAVIFFARDGSGSMDQYKCDIVSDMAWWMDLWIRRYYKRVESCYIWHDTEAKEVDQNKFYRFRYGGGTICSSALKEILKLVKPDGRYDPRKWNVYIFYFTDGENFGEDNKLFNEIIQKEMGGDIVNLIGITQIMSYYYKNSLKESVDLSVHGDSVRTTSIGNEHTPDMSQSTATGFWGGQQLSEEDRNAQILRGIKDLLGAKREKKADAEVKMAS